MQITENPAAAAIQKSAATQVEHPSQQDYITLLRRHDWEFEYSDDSRVHREGKIQRQAIEALQPRLDPDYALWNQYCHRMHRRPPAKAAA